jgi:response regulator RpfG family c-di-GMP phosphodiesterase
MDSQQLYVYSKKYLRQALEFYREISENHINSFLDFDINNDILSFINALAYFVYLDTFQELLLSFYRICDFVTYVHSCFVGEIAKRIINQLISKNPSFLLGVENYQTINKIRGHRQQLTILINNMAIFHDVGRICLVDLKLFYYRHPTDLENAMLNIHPTLGYNLMKKSTCPQAILDGILFHHDWYDGNNNSRLCTSSSKPLVDIIRVANDLDNQCDNALNPYGLGKPYDEVIAKMRLLKNREYSQEVIELFDDEHFYQEIKELMTSNKKDIIYRELNAKL